MRGKTNGPSVNAGPPAFKDRHVNVWWIETRIFRKAVCSGMSSNLILTVILLEEGRKLAEAARAAARRRAHREAGVNVRAVKMILTGPV
jgi:hypothetical protein